MRYAEANDALEQTDRLNVSTLPMVGVPEATSLLKRERFTFVGAPNRWRKEVDGSITRADIRRQTDGSCVVVLFHWTRPVPTPSRMAGSPCLSPI